MAPVQVAMAVAITVFVVFAFVGRNMKAPLPGSVLAALH
jgi:hypothetical protein